METLVNMTVKPHQILIGDLICADGKPARVKMIYQYWDGRWSFIVSCPVGGYSYPYKCTESDTVKLLSI